MPACPEVTIQKISEEQAGEDQGVVELCLSCPLRVELFDCLDVISHDVVAPQFVCVLQELEASLGLVWLEAVLLVGVEVTSNDAVDDRQPAEQTICLNVEN